MKYGTKKSAPKKMGGGKGGKMAAGPAKALGMK
jgi:hypothetical protein